MVQTNCLWILSFHLFWVVNASSGHNSSEKQGIAVARWHFDEFAVHITVILFLFIMALVKMLFHRIPHLIEYVPESLLLIILGGIFGAVVRYGVQVGSFGAKMWDLTPELFFNYLLPPIVLEAAYSLYNRTFSEYLGVVLIFAVLGTILNFLIIGFAMYGLSVIGAMGEPRDQFDLKSFLLFSSLIVAVDPVAVLAIFQEIGVELSLYYIVFGESLFNDAITVVLYNIMSAFVGTDAVSWRDIGIGVASFFTVSFGGLAIGVLVGVISCWATRPRSHLGSLTLFLLAYFSYVMADCVGWSGIISLIACGLIQAAYAFHNLERESVDVMHRLSRLVAEMSESVIFLYLGIEGLAGELVWHTGFILWSVILCLVARALVVICITAVVNRVRVDGTKLSFAEQMILIYGGLRGAVAFALAALIQADSLGPHGDHNRDVMITATIVIILLTVGLMGLTMKPLVRGLKIRMEGKKKLSLFRVLMSNLFDETLAAVEIIAAAKGRNVIRDTFKRWDEKYFRRILQREPATYDDKFMDVYEKIALKLHFAAMQPGKQEVFLEDVPESLQRKYLSRRGLSITPVDARMSLFEAAPPVARRRASSIVKPSKVIQPSDLRGILLSSRRASLAPDAHSQMELDENLAAVVATKTRGIQERRRSLQPIAEQGQEEDGCDEDDQVQPDTPQGPSVRAPTTSKKVSLLIKSEHKDDQESD
ncbi:Sodium/hydrogen exchanger 3 [Clonorchis sinensis]|uniref:Sodium/hydrogen exchanger n=2 Tax=Clonorchis sinensis TaxID=79923 RepID=A0A3R7GSF7_CLOSI|nr:Sodium/hydrogen exchanger 3 [Clonorchis sinensis]